MPERKQLEREREKEMKNSNSVAEECVYVLTRIQNIHTLLFSFVFVIYPIVL